MSTNAGCRAVLVAGLAPPIEGTDADPEGFAGGGFAVPVLEGEDGEDGEVLGMLG